ncbi:ankyrin repeat domain-containing protein [Chitinibacter sp. SCUT-21]|uniref:ankyrin repeat domain-containing protein n=1 Tax=Chitinibacter sp. SCUT-21 TaxID=2970891 RepID=UPI0035A59B67
MHLLSQQLRAIDRADLIPTELIRQFPAAADYIAQHWGQARLQEDLLNALVLDEQADPRYRQLANSPEVVREVMRLSIVYGELLTQIHSTDVWVAERELADLPNQAGYAFATNANIDLANNTVRGYVPDPDSIVPQSYHHEEWTALMQASFAGRLLKVRELLARGQNLSARDTDGHQALHLAALQGHHDVVLALLAVGADLDARSLRGNTALILAAAAGHLAVVAELISFGADLDQIRHDGRSALHQAAANGHDAIVVSLLQAGADAGLRTPAGQTALDLVPANKTRMAQLLSSAMPRRKLQVLQNREIVFQPLIDWS